MKQHINIGQLNELDVNIIAKIFDFDYDKSYKESGGLESDIFISRIVTIGKMIEMLQNNYNFDGIEYLKGIGKYEVTIVQYVSQYKYFQRKELCDALWDAVKDLIIETK